MREYELIIDEALKNGLSPEGKLPFNNQFLYECLGFRIGKAGLEAHKLLDNPLPLALDIHYNWPYPQMLTGELYNIFVVRNLLTNTDYVYSVSDDMATVTLIATLPFATYGTGTLMEAADFGEYVFMTNGVVMIYWNPETSAWVRITASTEIPIMRTICNFKGQAVGGNVVSSWYDCDETFYVWSMIGCFKFIPELSNEAGYKRCPFGGVVYHTRRLGDNVIGYSSKGITLITPSCDPAATYGFKEMEDIGLINKGAMNGNLFRHVYVGEDYILREVTQEGIKQLGYQWLMEQLTSSDIIVSYEPSNKDFYISDGVRTFLLSPNGLSEVMQHPSAVWRRSNTSYMIPDADDGLEPLITSWPFDFGYRGQKTNYVIESDVNNFDSAQAAVDYLLNQIWTESTFIHMNEQGISTNIAVGNAFRYKLKFDSVEGDFSIGYIKARYKMTDLRGIRGVYAPPLRGQSS